MPKLRAETAEAKRNGIVLAAERCFARQGFHRTTMQDVIREAGQSAGGVYGYFASKGELIAAIAERRHARDTRLLTAAQAQEPFAFLKATARAFLEDLDSPDGEMARRVGVQVWAEALRDDHMRDQVVRGLREPLHAMEAALSRARAGGFVREDVALDSVARALTAMFHGVVLQRLWGEPVDSAALLATFDALLDGLRPAR